jgi:indolepyruvate decarboxylase
LGRLKEIGVDDVFGVAGDYAFPVNDAIVEHPSDRMLQRTQRGVRR